jgi:hypothetical protein
MNAKYDLEFLFIHVNYSIKLEINLILQKCLFIMNRLSLEKLNVDIRITDSQLSPRRYTLTHSDRTGDLYLTVDWEFDEEQISGWYTKLMRDEVLAEWQILDDIPSLHIYIHVGGGLVFGTAGMREQIFRNEMSLVLESIRNGDREFFQKNSDFDNAFIYVHFQKSGKDYKTEKYGKLSDYVINR